MKNYFKVLSFLITFILIYACQNEDEVVINDNFVTIQPKSKKSL